MGVNGAHNTVEENVGAYNTVCVREVAEYYFCRCTGYSPWYYGLTCAPCFAFSVRSLVFSERASPVGWFQPALVAPVGEEQRAGFLHTLVGDVGLESEVVFWLGLPVEEAIRRWAGDRSEPSGRRGGPESENGRRSSSVRPSGR